MTRDLTRLEGLFVGGSGGAAVAGAIKYARDGEPGEEDGDRPARILVFLATAGTSTSRRSSTTTGCARTASSRTSRGSGRCATSSPGEGRRAIVTATPTSKVRDVIDTMKPLGDQPAPRRRDGASCAGSWPRSTSFGTSSPGGKTLDSPIGELVEGDYATVTPTPRSSSSRACSPTRRSPIVEDRDEILGIVTKIDLIDFLAKSPQKPLTTPAESVGPPLLHPALELGVEAAHVDGARPVERETCAPTRGSRALRPRGHPDEATAGRQRRGRVAEEAIELLSSPAVREAR